MTDSAVGAGGDVAVGVVDGVDGDVDWAKRGMRTPSLVDSRYAAARLNTGCCSLEAPRRSSVALVQIPWGRGDQDSTRDPLYCRGCCNRQRRREDLQQHEINL